MPVLFLKTEGTPAVTGIGKFNPTRGGEQKGFPRGVIVIQVEPVPGWKITPGSVNELALAAPAQARTRRPARKNRALLIYTPPAGIGLYQRLHARVQSCDQLLHLRPNNINRL